MPTTIVKIKWDKPNERGWLCDENIKLCLSKYCMNTLFEVEEILTTYEDD